MPSDLPDKCHIVGSTANGFAYSFSYEKGVGPIFRTKEEARVAAWKHVEIPVLLPITTPLYKLDPEAWK